MPRAFEPAAFAFGNAGDFVADAVTHDDHDNLRSDGQIERKYDAWRRLVCRRSGLKDVSS